MERVISSAASSIRISQVGACAFAGSNVLNISHQSAILNVPVASADSGMLIMSGLTPARKTVRYTDDPSILAMSDEEYLAAIAASGGSMADEKDWVADLRAGWEKRLNDFETDAPPHPPVPA